MTLKDFNYYISFHTLRTTLCEYCRIFFSLIRAVSDLSEPVDVYSDWIDACEVANQ